MQTVTNRQGNVVNVTLAEIHTLKDVVENRRDCGGGTHRERRVARRELRRRGYAWYVIFDENVSTDSETGDTYRLPDKFSVSLLHESQSHEEDVWSRGCVSPSEAYDRWNRKSP
ncbi:MAG: hypothetical protein V4526_00405 [Patescibacteria group bacterium]